MIQRTLCAITVGGIRPGRVRRVDNLLGRLVTRLGGLPSKRMVLSGTLGDTAFAGMATPVNVAALRRPGSTLDELLITTAQQDGSAQVIRLTSPFTAPAATTTVSGLSWPVGPIQ